MPWAFVFSTLLYVSSDERRNNGITDVVDGPKMFYSNCSIEIFSCMLPIVFVLLLPGQHNLFSVSCVLPYCLCVLCCKVSTACEPVSSLVLLPSSSSLTFTSWCEARPPCSACCLFTPIQGIHLRGHSSNKFTQQPLLSRDLSLRSQLARSVSLRASLSTSLRLLYSIPHLFLSLFISVSFCLTGLLPFCFSLSNWTPEQSPSITPTVLLSDLKKKFCWVFLYLHYLDCALWRCFCCGVEYVLGVYVGLVNRKRNLLQNPCFSHQSFCPLIIQDVFLLCWVSFKKGTWPWTHT